MKNRLVVYFAIMLAGCIVSCRQAGHGTCKADETEFINGSGISTNHYNAQTVEDLAVLCKVWGFLKYYHPTIAKGECNWDFELFRVMPSILNSTSKEKRNKILARWIKRQGSSEKTQETLNMVDPDSVKMYPDIDWIEDETSLGKASRLLMKVRDAEREKERFDTAYLDFMINRLLKREESYSSMKYPDVGFRLLALFRYWNIIQYYFPYKYLIGEDWHAVLSEFIPQMIDAKDGLEYRLTLLKLVARINDTHADIGDDPFIENYKGGRIALPEIAFVEGKAVVTGFFKGESKDGCPLKIGDVITSIHRESVDSIVRRKLPYTSASNYATKLRQIAGELLRSNSDELLVGYERKGQSLSATIATHSLYKVNTSISKRHKPCYQVLANDISYIYLGSIEGGTLPADINSRGMVIDLRCYPTPKVKGYTDFVQLYPDVVDMGKGSYGSTQYPGLFSFTVGIMVGTYNPSYYKGKKIILVNEITQSHAEFMAMRYRCAPNSIVVGSTTAGSTGHVLRFALPGGIQTSISGFGVYYPDGREIQRVGIVPDIEVKPTIKGIREGRDELLEKAVQIILESE